MLPQLLTVRNGAPRSLILLVLLFSRSQAVKNTAQLQRPAAGSSCWSHLSADYVPGVLICFPAMCSHGVRYMIRVLVHVADFITYRFFCPLSLKSNGIVCDTVVWNIMFCMLRTMRSENSSWVFLPGGRDRLRITIYLGSAIHVGHSGYELLGPGIVLCLIWQGCIATAGGLEHLTYIEGFQCRVSTWATQVTDPGYWAGKIRRRQWRPKPGKQGGGFLVALWGKMKESGPGLSWSDLMENIFCIKSSKYVYVALQKHCRESFLRKRSRLGSGWTCVLPM